MAQTPRSAYKWVFKVNSTKLGSLICPQPDSYIFKVIPKHIWATEYAHFGCIGNGQKIIDPKCAYLGGQICSGLH